MRFGSLIVSSVLLAVLAAACATTESGQQMDRVAIDALAEGTATRQDIESRLGRPTAVTTNANGQTVLVYSHVIGHGNGLTGKASATATMATFVFDKGGVLVSKTVTSSDSRSGQ